jgi:NAD-dependent SIR2 family protein deacetylase
MGNIPADGIKYKGELKTLYCPQCNQEFEARINVVTIKGPKPNPKFCQSCTDENNKNFMDVHF